MLISMPRTQCESGHPQRAIWLPFPSVAVSHPLLAKSSERNIEKLALCFQDSLSRYQNSHGTCQPLHRTRTHLLRKQHPQRNLERTQRSSPVPARENILDPRSADGGTKKSRRSAYSCNKGPLQQTTGSMHGFSHNYRLPHWTNSRL